MRKQSESIRGEEKRGGKPVPMNPIQKRKTKANTARIMQENPKSKTVNTTPPRTTLIYNGDGAFFPFHFQDQPSPSESIPDPSGLKSFVHPETNFLLSPLVSPPITLSPPAVTVLEFWAGLTVPPEILGYLSLLTPRIAPTPLVVAVAVAARFGLYPAK